MQRQHTGRPGTRVRPADWEGEVAIGPAVGASSWNEDAGETQTATAPPVYTGPARIMPVSDSARILTVVEDPTSTRVYDVMLPLAGPGADLVMVDHVVTVTSSSDPALTGKTLQVTAVERGTARFSRVILALLLD